MKLDRTTYEAWLLDRAEGSLTPEQERLLDAFLLANPDLSAPEVAFPRLKSTGETFHHKDSLLRSFPPSGAPDAVRLNDFLAARLEGDLSPEQEKQLDRYLYEHPEAARHAMAMAKAKVVAAPIPFEGKTRLQRQFPPHGLPGAHNLTDFLIALVEGDLTAEQQSVLKHHLLLHPAAQREHRLVAAARIQPTPLAFPWKPELRKREVRILPLWTRWAAAASVALLMSMGWWMYRNNQQPVTHIAQTTNHPVVTTPPALPTNTMEKGQRLETNPSTVHRQVAGRSASSDRIHTLQQLPASVCNKPEPEVPPEEEPTPDPTPALALASASASEPTEPSARAASSEAGAIAETPATSSQTLGVYVANKLRGEVLDAPPRPFGVDGNDALAVANKAISAVSGGHGGIQVHTGANSERIRLSFGRNFSISASRGR